jgi:DNA-binding transcriptional LysR family regulator
METLMREPFVVREKGSDTWFSMEDAFGEHIRELNIAMEIKSTETIKQAIIAGMGIGFLSAHTIGQELRTGSLVVLPVQGFPLMLDWYVVHRNDKRLPPVARAFKEFLLAEGAGLIEKLIPTPKPAKG